MTRLSKPIRMLAITLLVCLGMLGGQSLAFAADGAAVDGGQLKVGGVDIQGEQPVKAAAAGNQSGSCGPGLTWTLDSNGKLTISGYGTMNDYDHFTDVPWYNYKDQVKSISIGNQVTWIGDYAFYYMSNLTSPVTIPSSVIHIGHHAFFCYNPTSVVLNEGLNEIGDCAFAESNLTSVTLPSTLYSIGEEVFRYQNWYSSTKNPLKSVTIKNGLGLIGKMAFYGCNALTSVTIPSSVQSIGDGAFEYCTALMTLNLSSGLESIGESAFCACSKLQSLALPDSVWVIGKEAFESCKSLKTADLGRADIGSQAFVGCNSLESITIAGSEVGDHAFENCAALSSVFFETDDYGTYYIYASAFKGCTSLTNVKMPRTIVSVGANAFSNCASLEALYFPYLYNDGVCSISADSFDGDTTTIYYPRDSNRWSGVIGATYGGAITWKPSEVIESGSCGASANWTLDNVGTLAVTGSGAMVDYDNANDQPWLDLRDSIITVLVKERITSVGGNAFASCPVEQVYLPNTIVGIGNRAFCDTHVKIIKVPENVQTIGSEAFSQNSYLYEASFSEGTTDLGAGAFEGCESLAVLELPQSLRVIGANAFKGCKMIWSIALPEGIEEVGESAFSGCENLGDELSFKNVRMIGKNAFNNCKRLPSIVFLGAAPQFGEGCFSGDTLMVCYSSLDASWTSDVMQQYGGRVTWQPNKTKISGTCGKDLTWSLDYLGNLTIIGSGPMNDFSLYNPDDEAGTEALPWGDYVRRIRTISLPEGITEIGTEAFYECKNVKQIAIPNTVTRIGTNAFSGSCITEAILPQGLTQFDGAFIDCKKLVTIVLPNQIDSIPDFSFAGCESLQNIDIPAGVELIGEFAFSDCHSLTSIDIPSSVKEIGECAFWNCSSLEQIAIPDSVVLMGSDAFYLCVSLKKVSIGKGLTTIPEYAFGKCDSLTNINIPNSVVKIERGAFYSCGSLKEVALPENLQSIGEIVFEYDKSLATVNIPSGVRRIPNEAFYGCSSLASVEIPEGVSSIGDRAFYGCSSLATIDVPEGLMRAGLPEGLMCAGLPESLTSIGDRAFYGCKSMEIVKLWSNIRTLGSQCFSGCDALVDVYFSGDAPSIADDAFLDVQTTFMYPYDNGTWNDDTMLDYGGEIGYAGVGDLIAYGPTWTLHADGTLYIGRTGLWTYVEAPIVIPDVGAGAGTLEPWGQYENRITSLKILGNVTRIGAGAFAGCTSLEVADMADSVVSIGAGAFEGCTALSEAVLSKNLESIGANAFQGCTSLAQIDLSESLASIGANAFAGCSSLTEVTVPESVTTMGAGCFDSAVKINCVAGSAAAEYAARNGNPAVVHTHVWGAPTWNWASDSAATATFVCQEVADHVKTIDASVSQTVMVEATYLEEGTKLCVAVVSLDGQTYSDVKTVAIPKLEGLANSITGTAAYTKTYAASAQTFKLDAKARGGKLAYASSNAAKVSVNAAGNVTIGAKAPAGTYTITATASDATGKYKTASMKVTITINPSATKIASAKNKGAKKVVVKWKKNPSATGYEVQCSTSKKFKSGVKTIKAKKGAKKATFKKLKKGKTYYARIRTVAVVGGKTYYSAWSAKKKVKVTR